MKKGMSLLLAIVTLLLMCDAFAETNEDEFVFICPYHENQMQCTKCEWFGGSMIKVICSTCSGCGTETCMWCDGSGRIKCSSCAGSGYASKTYNVKCSTCKGKGKVTCSSWVTGSTCGGSGTVKCSKCRGEGIRYALRTSCPECSSRVVCNVCLGYNGKSLSTDWSGFEAFEYNKVMRRPDEHIGMCYAITGKIISIEQLENAANVHSIALTNNTDGMSYLYSGVYFSSKDADRLLYGDQINAYGVFTNYDKKNNPFFAIYNVELMP